MNQARTTIGTVVSLWRYPVKSMLGEELNSSYVTERGLLGDRTYAVVDNKTGKVASAKNPRKWGKLFDFRSVFFIDPLPSPPSPQAQVVENVPPPVRITFPDGTHILSDQGNKFWSQALKEPDKKMVLSIVLSAVTNALRERPERYNIIFNDDTSNSEKQNAVLEVANTLANSVIERSVNQIMHTLESQAETESEAEDTEST